MTNTADMFPGFESHTLRTEGGSVHVRVGGDGAPLLLLHGFPPVSYTHLDVYKRQGRHKAGAQFEAARRHPCEHRFLVDTLAPGNETLCQIS